MGTVFKRVERAVADAVGKHGAKKVLDTVLHALVLPAEDALADAAPESFRVYAKAGAAAAQVQTEHLFARLEKKLGLLDGVADEATGVKGSGPEDAA